MSKEFHKMHNALLIRRACEFKRRQLFYSEIFDRSSKEPDSTADTDLGPTNEVTHGSV